jgi:hypothetical protein
MRKPRPCRRHPETATAACALLTVSCLVSTTAIAQSQDASGGQQPSKLQNPRQLTSVQNSYPSPSPDGSQVVFQ